VSAATVRSRRAAAARAPIRRAPRGLTLIELLITMAISLVILGAVSYTYLGSKGAYRTNESLARAQETGRFALDALVRDLHGTGYLGCGSAQTATNASPTVYAVGKLQPVIDYTQPDKGVVMAYPQGLNWNPLPWNAPPPNYVPGTDVLSVWVATSAPYQLTADPDDVAGRLTIDGKACQWLVPSGNILTTANMLILSSCTRAMLVLATSAPGCPGAGSASATPVTIGFQPDASGASAFGAQGRRGLSLASFPTVQQFDQVTYYVGTNSANGKSLYRIAASDPRTTAEVVDGVEDMYLKFGAGSGSVVNGYVDASAIQAAGNWSNVVSVQIQLLVVGGDLGATRGAVDARQTYTFRGVPQQAPDTRYRDVFSTTVALRNRMS